MSELLSLDDYRGVAAELQIPDSAYIDGGYHRCGGDPLVTTNPADGAVLATIQMADEADVDMAVQKAREAFDSGAWSRLHPAERKAVLIRLAKLVKRNRHQLAVLEAMDSGKPVSDCASIDIPEVINTIIWHAEAIDKIYDDAAPVGSDALALVVREPIGVVAAVLPWNFPLLMLAWKLGPALAAGNCLIAIKRAVSRKAGW